jgi:hypothetical protein
VADQDYLYNVTLVVRHDIIESIGSSCGWSKRLVPTVLSVARRKAPRLSRVSVLASKSLLRVVAGWVVLTVVLACAHVVGIVVVVDE